MQGNCSKEVEVNDLNDLLYTLLEVRIYIKF